MPGFSWRALDRATAATARLPAGRYALDVVNQHKDGWCGACYLVAAAQCVDDRGYIASCRRAAAQRSGRCSRQRLSLQAVMDHFQQYWRLKDDDPLWNSCHGGWSSEVFQCFVDKQCPLVWERGSSSLFEWWGFARGTTRCAVSTVSYEVVSHGPVSPREVPHRLATEGPLVLEIAAEVCLSADERGVCRDLTPRGANHAVCVVGWEEVQGVGTCWVCRNSWGKSRVPDNLPKNYRSCVGVGFNECDEPTQPWKGMPSDPGFFLLPFSYAPLSRENPSPWMAPTIALASSKG